MYKVGRVIKVKGDVATIEIQRTTSCGEKCATCKSGCTPTDIYIDVINESNAAVGQTVTLVSETKKVMKAAFWVYTLPLLSMVSGISLGVFLGNVMGYENLKELIGIGIGLVFLCISFIFLNKQDKKINKSNGMPVKISRVIK